MANSPTNYNVSVTISVDKDAADATSEEVKSFSDKLVEGFGKIEKISDGIKASYQAIRAAIEPVYNLLIKSNEELNQNILKQQTFLAQSTRIFDGLGKEFLDVGDKIDSTRATLKEALIQVQRDTTELVGVTTQEVNEAFGIVIQNAGSITGQFSKDFAKDTIDASRVLTKGVVAAIGTLGLGQDQVRQEFTALITGDLNNPDAVLAKTLKIRKAEFEKAKASGTLVDFLSGKLEVFVEANKRASRSIEGISSNLVSFVEDVGRAAGEPLLEPIVEALDSLQQKLLPLTGSLSKEFAQFSKTLVPALSSILKKTIEFGEGLFKVVKFLFKALVGSKKDVTGALESIDLVFKSLVDTINLSIQGYEFLGQTVDLLVPSLRGNAEEIGLIAGGLRGFGELLATTGEGLEKFTRGESRAESIQTAFGDAVANTGAIVVRVQKNYEELTALLQKANDVGGIVKLSDEEKTRLGILQNRIKTEETGLDVLKENIKEQRTLGLDTQVVTDAFITRVDQARETLQQFQKDAVSQTGLDPDKILIKEKEIVDKFELLEAFREKFNSVSRTLKAGGAGDETVFQGVAEEIIGLSSQLESLDEDFKVSDVIANLRLVRDDTRVTKETRLEAAEAITNIIETQSERRVDAIERSQNTINELVAKGSLTSSEAAIKGLEIESTVVADQILAAKKKLKEAQDLGSESAIRQFENELKDLESRATLIPFEVTSAVLEDQQSKLSRVIEKSEARIQEIQSRRSLEITKLEVEGFTTRSELAERSSQVATQQAQLELKVAKDRRKALDALETPANIDERIELQNQRRDAALQELQATESLVRAEADLEEASRDRILEQLTLENQQSKLRLDNIVLLAEQEKLSTEEITKIRLDAQRIELEREKGLQKARLDLLSDRPVINQEEILSIKESINGIDRQLISNTQELLSLSEELRQTDEARADLLAKEALSNLKVQLFAGKKTLEELGELEENQAVEAAKREIKLIDDTIANLDRRSSSEQELIDLQGRRFEAVATLAEAEKQLAINATDTKIQQELLQDKLFERELIIAKTGLKNLKLQTKEEENNLRRLNQSLVKIEQQRENIVIQQREGLEKENALAALENQRLDTINNLVTAQREFIKSTLAREIELKERSLSIDDQSLGNRRKQLDLQKQADGLATSSLERQAALLRTQLELSKTIGQARIQTLQRRKSLLEDSLGLQQSLTEAGFREAQVIRRILQERGESQRLTSSAIERQRDLTLDIANAEFKQKQLEIEQNNIIVKIQQKQAEISARRLVQDAKLSLQTLQIEKQKLRIELARTKLLPEEQQAEQAAIFREALQLQEQAIELGESGVASAVADKAQTKTLQNLQNQIRKTANDATLEDAQNNLKQKVNQADLTRARALDNFYRQPVNVPLQNQPDNQNTNQASTKTTNNFNFSSAVNARSSLRALGL